MNDTFSVTKWNEKNAYAVFKIGKENKQTHIKNGLREYAFMYFAASVDQWKNAPSV